MPATAWYCYSYTTYMRAFASIFAAITLSDKDRADRTDSYITTQVCFQEISMVLRCS